MGISCRQSDWQLSSLAQVCNSSIPQALIPIIEHWHFYIIENEFQPPHWQDDREHSMAGAFSFIYHPEVSYLCQEFVPRIAPALQELIRESVTDVTLPAEYFFGGAPAIGTCSGSHQAVRWVDD